MIALATAGEKAAARGGLQVEQHLCNGGDNTARMEKQSHWGKQNEGYTRTISATFL